jgi:hypothetical protein
MAELGNQCRLAGTRRAESASHDCATARLLWPCIELNDFFAGSEDALASIARVVLAVAGQNQLGRQNRDARRPPQLQSAAGAP